MLEINAAWQSTGKNAMEAELTWIDCGATSGHFMNQKDELLIGKMWDSPPTYTSMNVCMHEIKK